MRKHIIIKSILLSHLFILFSCSISNNPALNINLPILFSDNMVLQRDKNIPVWGTAEPGGNVFVEIAGQKKSTEVSEDGKWQINFPPMPAGGPYELTILGQDTIICKNVMVGEVWLCSGQSNMEMAVKSCNNYNEEVANADYPNIRLFQVKQTTSNQPLDTIICDGWEECSPKTIPDFSSVAYFFGRKLFNELGITIGLIHSSWGGTPAEAWTSAEALKAMPDFRDEVKIIESILPEHKQSMEDYEAEVKLRDEKIVTGDAGFNNGQPIWNNPNLDVQGWKTMNLPTKWENAGYPDLDGKMWFRKEINLPASMTGTDLVLHLGPVNDIDITWFNGIKIGNSSGASKLREYKIPKSLVKTGKNVIVVNVHDIGNSGGIWGNADQMFIENRIGVKILISGEWLCKIGFDAMVLGPKPNNPNDPNIPSVLFNSMIHPLVPYGIRGTIWYQGESNASRAYQYQTLFPNMIKDWRTQWNQDDFPFLFVQLANYMQLQTESRDDEWAELREAQLKTLSLPNTGMAVTIDIGDALDIHPKNKQEVGRRLALNALAKVYGKEIPYSGPIYQSMKIEENKIRLQFSNTDKGLKTNGSDKPIGFAIAGDDKKFVWAEAEIEDNEVVVWNSKIKNPVAVRYAWASNPVCNLFNKAGLPASPFRTDNWEGITYKKE